MCPGAGRHAATEMAGLGWAPKLRELSWVGSMALAIAWTARRDACRQSRRQRACKRNASHEYREMATEPGVRTEQGR